jgi:hypothetical protein
MLLVLMLGMLGLAVDLGRVYTTRAQLSRSLDAAALAGVIELPNTTTATSKAVTYMNVNMPSATNISAVPDASLQTVTISATASVNTLFMKLIGVNSVSVHADAQAGASNIGTLVKLDAVLVLDDTGSIGSGCSDPQRTTPGQSDAYYAGCPLGLERNGAKAFLDTLYPAGVPVGSTQAAMVPFRGCYNPAGFVNKYGQPNLNAHDEGNNPTWNMTRGCVSRGDIAELSHDPSVSAGLKVKIDALRGEGGYPGTNLCLAYSEGWRHLSDPTYAQPGARKVLVILSDGDQAYWDGSETANLTSAFTSGAPGWATSNLNLYNPAPSDLITSVGSYTGLKPLGIASEPNDCWPSSPNITSTSMPNAQYDSRINTLDVQALQWGDFLKAQGVEIYVVGFGVSAGPNVPSEWCDATMRTAVNAGYSDRRNTATDVNDRKLNKCMASSKSGTNDHYFETTAAGLIGAFQNIATQISFRLTK